ncbi:MAG: deoxyuridine 5-triphosphate nucleotidohydrolase Dut [Pseudomonadota bacterium]|jgi:dUTP pyrophosphatase
MKTIRIQRLDSRAGLPTRAHPGDAGLDLYALEAVTVGPGQGLKIRTGIALEIEPGWVGMIADRSSLAARGLKTAGGIIDAGYRGEVQLVVWNLSREPVSLNAGDRVAQLLLLPVSLAGVEEATSLSDSARATGGFGSSGA